jgi:hypothetical protein
MDDSEAWLKLWFKRGYAPVRAIFHEEEAVALLDEPEA